MIYYETELYHHGVKGMKWGRRKQRITMNRKAKIRNHKYNPKSNIKSLAERRARTTDGRLKSVKRIVGETIATDLAVGVGGTIAATYLKNKGHEDLSTIVQGVATGTSIVNGIVGITAAVQRGRGKYGKK